MIRRHWYLLLLLFFLCGGLSLAQEPKKDDPEPTLQRRPLSDWLEKLKSDSIRNRRDAADTLRGVGPWATEAVPTLAGALTDPDSDVRRYVAFALGNIGEGAKDAVEPLAQAVAKDREIAVRYAAAQALGKIGPAAESALPVLKKAMKDSSHMVRIRAVEAIALISKDERKWMLDYLHDLFRNDIVDESARIEAAVTLAHLAPKEARGALPLLSRAFTTQSAFVQVRAADAITRIAPDRAENVIPLLSDFLNNVNERGRVRMEAAKVLARLDPDKAKMSLSVLLKYFREGDGSERLTALEALQLIDPSIAERLQKR